MADINVSNGTCYTGANQPAEVMIPCGNAYFGHVGCCQAGDHCLSSSVCYNGQYGTTYITGCTDPAYRADVCPEKFEEEDPWMGMSYCNGTSNEWVLCEQVSQPQALTVPGPCWCPTATGARSMTLSESSAIVATASLPYDTSSSISWVAGFEPTTPSAFLPSQSPDTTTSSDTTSTVPSSDGTASSAGSTSTIKFSSDKAFTTTGSPYSTTSASGSVGYTLPPFPTRFSPTAKAGAAIGGSIFGILLLAGVGFFILRQRRASNQEALDKLSKANPQDGPVGPAGDGSNTVGNGIHEMESIAAATPRASVASQLESKTARPWSVASELDGQGHGAAGGQSRMEAIAEAGHGQGLWQDGAHRDSYPGQWRYGSGSAAPSELGAPHGVAELPA